MHGYESSQERIIGPWQQILTYTYFTAAHLLPYTCMYAQQGFIASWAPRQLLTRPLGIWHRSGSLKPWLCLSLQPTRAWPDNAWWYPVVLVPVFSIVDPPLTGQPWHCSSSTRNNPASSSLEVVVLCLPHTVTRGESWGKFLLLIVILSYGRRILSYGRSLLNRRRILSYGRRIFWIEGGSKNALTRSL